LTGRRAAYYLGQVEAKENAYGHLRAIKRHLGFPSTAPKAKSIDEILRILSMPDEAAIAINMSMSNKGDEGKRYQHA
jgi:uncharacterized ferredoxin-like protein